MTNHLIIVDPIKLGQDLLDYLKKKGHRLFIIYTLEPDALAKFDVKQTYIEEALLCPTPQAAADIILQQGLKINAVIPGSEPATGFVNKLSHILNVPTNHGTAPDRFRDKRVMRQYASQKGVKIPRFQSISASRYVPDSLLTSQDSKPSKIPQEFILKPIDGAGSDCIKTVSTTKEVKSHIALNKKNLFGHKITDWLLEEYIRGPEYAINTLSINGQHIVIDIWEYQLNQDAKNLVYDNPYWNTLHLPINHDHHLLSQAVLEILDKFEVKFGFSHIEVKRNIADEEIYLIEIGWRLPGANMPQMWKKVWNLNPFEEIEKIYSNKPINITSYQNTPEKELMGLIFIRNEKEGILESIEGLNEIRHIPEIVEIEHVHNGEKISLTEDLQSYAAKFMIRGKTRDELENLASKIRSTIKLKITPDNNKPSSQAEN